MGWLARAGARAGLKTAHRLMQEYSDWAMSLPRNDDGAAQFAFSVGAFEKCFSDFHSQMFVRGFLSLPARSTDEAWLSREVHKAQVANLAMTGNHFLSSRRKLRDRKFLYMGETLAAAYFLALSGAPGSQERDDIFNFVCQIKSEADQVVTGSE